MNQLRAKALCTGVVAVLWASLSASGAPIIIDAGDAGWSFEGEGCYANGKRLDWTWAVAYGGTADQLNNGTATWAFTALTPGTYNVYVSKVNKQAGWTGDYESNEAPFSVYDGATLLGGATVDQEYDHDQGDTPGDLTYDGADWYKIGTYTITGNALSVVLTAPAGDGRSTLTDAVMIDVVPEPASLVMVGIASALMWSGRRRRD